MLDTRSTAATKKVEVPEVAAGELWVDPDFTQEIAMQGREQVEWKRPAVCVIKRTRHRQTHYNNIKI